MTSQIIRPGKAPDPVMHMIVPGRRAYGEEWSKVTIRPDEATGGYAVEREDTTAPVDNTPIFVPGLGNVSIEMADFILERERDKANERVKAPKQSQAEVEKELNEAWQDYMQQKLRWFKGQTTLGQGGFFQRETS